VIQPRERLLNVQNLLEDTWGSLERAWHQRIKGEKVLGQSDRDATELILNFGHQRYPSRPLFDQHVIFLRKRIPEIAVMAHPRRVANQRSDVGDDASEGLVKFDHPR
jgi:hypothetical protein